MRRTLRIAMSVICALSTAGCMNVSAPDRGRPRGETENGSTKAMTRDHTRKEAAE